jgi:hypothetical protein
MSEETSLCPHERLTTAYCPDCAIEADLYQPRGLDPPEQRIKIADCVHGIRIDRYCPMCDTEQIHTGGSSSYYDLPRGATRLHDVIRGKNMEWTQANIFKAAYRWREKPDLQYNIEKILWFAEDEKKHLKRLGLWKDAKNAVFGK